MPSARWRGCGCEAHRFRAKAGVQSDVRAGVLRLRLDKFLFFTRLVKTRVLAQRLAEAGHLRIDSRPTDRSHAEVRPGMVLSFPLNDRVRVLRIEAIPLRRGPAEEAQACYTDLSPPAAG